MVRNPLIALLLGVIPGLGHFAVNRKGRGVVYPLLFLGALGLSFLMAVVESDGFIFAVGCGFALVIWGINMMDLVIFLLLRSGTVPRRTDQTGYNGANYAQGAAEAGRTTMGSPPPLGSFPSFDGQRSGYAYSGSGAAADNPAYRERDDAGEKFYTILLSLVPGLGHLQLGLMQRGLTLLIGFFGLMTMILFVAILSREEGVLVFVGVLPIVWLYGMFDAIRLVQRKQAGELLEDRPIMDDWNEHRHGGKRSRWFATVLSIMPGAGHMYLGLQKRGLQLMVGFLLSIYLLDTLQLSIFLFLVPIIWCFAFFDSLQQQSRYSLGFGELQDVPLVDWLVHRQKWLGISLVLLGIYYLSDQLLLEFLQKWFDDYHLKNVIRYYFKIIATSLILIGLGVRLIMGRRTKGGTVE